MSTRRGTRESGSGGLGGTIAEVTPVGGGSDDATRILAALSAASYQGEVRLRAGVWRISTPVVVPSGTTLIVMPGTRIGVDIGASVGASPTNAAFYAAPPASTVSTTLAADTVPGARTLTLTDATDFPPGTELAVIVTNSVAGYMVRSRVGNTVTVDRVVLHNYPAGTSVIDRIPPRDIRLLFNGAIVDGVEGGDGDNGDAVVEFSGVAHGHVEGLVVRAEYGLFDDVLVNFDVASRKVRLTDCDLDCGGAGGADSAFHFECVEHGRAERVQCRRAAAQGFLITEGFGCELDQVHTEGSLGVGGAISTGDLTVAGTKAMSLVGCTFVGSIGIGLEVRNVSSLIKIVNCEARNNGGYGFAVNVAGGVGATDTHFANCNSSQNQGGFYVATACTGITIVGCIADECTLYGYTIAGAAQLSAIYSRECLTGGLLVGAGGRATVAQADFSRVTDGAWTAFTNQSTVTRPLDVRGALVTMAGTNTKIAISGQADAVVYAADFLTSGGTLGWVAGSAGRLFLRGPNVRMESCATPYSGGTTSFGSVTLNGTSNVDFAFSAATTGDRPRARRTAIGGTPGHFTVSPIAGGIRVASEAGDTSTLAVDLI